MSNIFKVFHITKEQVKQCFVFIGNVREYEEIKTENLSDLFLSNPQHKVFESIFTEAEQKEIREKK